MKLTTEIDIKPPFDFYNLETGELKKVNTEIMERLKEFKLKIGATIFISDCGEVILTGSISEPEPTNGSSITPPGGVITAYVALSDFSGYTEFLFYDYIEFCDRNNQIVIASKQFIRDLKIKKIYE